MANIFKVGKEYPDQLDFYRDLDKYESRTDHVLVSHDTRTMNAVHTRRVNKTGDSSRYLYEAVYHCVRGKAKKSPEDSSAN
ncbi:hypothetical protein KQX54_000670, partial [Cotesia glomerata]